MRHLNGLVFLSGLSISCMGTSEGSGSETEASQTSSSTAPTATIGTLTGGGDTTGSSNTTATGTTSLSSTTGSTTLTTTTSTETTGTTDGPILPDGITKCTFSGPIDFNEFDGPRRSVLELDASALYIQTYLGDIRRFIVGNGADCTLALDTTFGEGGLLEQDDAFMSLAVDGLSRLYAPRDLHDDINGFMQVWPASPLSCLEDSWIWSVALSPDGKYMAAAGSKEAFTIKLDGDECSTQVVPDYDPGAELFVDSKGRLHMSYSSGFVERIEIITADGEQVGVYGNPDDGFAADGLCGVTDMTACGGDVCIYDGNCKSLTRFSEDGSFIDYSENETGYTIRSIAGAANINDVFMVGSTEDAGLAVFRVAL